MVFNPSKDVTSQAGKVILITGGKSSPSNVKPS